MKFSKYIAEHKLWLGIALFLILTIDIFLMTIKGSGYLMAYVAVAVLGGVILGMYVDYARLKRFLYEVKRNVDEIDEKYLVADLLAKPELSEEEIVCDILKAMEFSMADKVSDYRRRSEEYKEYVETWVHEVKIPISTARMIIENHRSDSVEESGIMDEVERISTYVEQALFYARSEAVEKDYYVKSLNLSEVVGSALTARKKSLIAMKASIDMAELEDAEEVLSDGKWLTFIIGQIIDNSIKYAKADEKLSLSFFVREDEGKKSLVIEDNGIGMKEEETGRAFEKGFTGSNGRIGKASTGIGLYLCKKLCLRLGHDINIESRIGEGTSVIIAF
ncbi:MAG: sensor histidine kinase [Lachnospiraceae bacterium]|nr:sensor histidine kinase [Lachnospiraceae bacterium]